jgi:hypothetical protein
MPRYVIVLGNSADLFDDARRTLLADGRFIDGGDTIHCDGTAAPLTNIYAVDMSPAEWDSWAPADGMPDPRTMSTLMLECGSPAWVAEVGAMLARGLDTPIWFVDSADAVWQADQVDAEQIALG